MEENPQEKQNKTKQEASKQTNITKPKRQKRGCHVVKISAGL